MLLDYIYVIKNKNHNPIPPHWEREIDELVYKLYGLTDEEIEIVKGTKLREENYD